MFLKGAKRKNKKGGGFWEGYTLVEIMIVVTIIALLAMIAVPNLLRSRMSANEALAVTNLRRLSDACQLYYSHENNFPAALADLSAASPQYADPTLTAGATVNQYTFVYQANGDQGFTLRANVAGGGIGKYFYTDESNAVRMKINAPAGPGDELVR